MEGMRNNLADESRKLDARTNEYDLLKSLVDSMEGYPESVKFLHNNNGWNKDAPLLSDIIYVKEAYRAAVENVLDPYLNYYVVNNLAEGLQAIHLLDENKKGKANFFLLDKFTDTTIHTTPADTLPAMDVVEFDAKYANLAKQLLGNVFIAENGTALEHSPDVYDGSSVILEKTGKFVKGKYAITGGSVGMFEGKKIGRAKNLEKLQAEIIVQNASVAALKMEIQAKHNEVINFNEQLKENVIKQTQQDINSLTNLVFSLQNKIENLTQQQTTGATRSTELENQLETNHDAIADTRTELDKFNTQLDELADKLQTIEAAYASAEQEYNFAGASYNESNINFAKQQSKVVSLKTELDFKTNQLADLQVQVESSTVQLKDSDEAINTTAETLQEIEALLVTMLQNKETDEKQLNEADQAYYNLRNALTEKESALRQKQKSKEIIDTLFK